MVSQNGHSDPAYTDISWNLRGIPYNMVQGIWSRITSRNRLCIVANVFHAVQQIIHSYKDDHCICITDMDIIPLRPYNGVLPNFDQIIACDIYEDWHMHITDPSKQNHDKITPWLEHDDHQYMNGGFVPVIMRVKTFKAIADDVINITEQIIESEGADTWKWWACMTALNIACHNNRIQMVNADNTYVPSINTLQEHHGFAHYSVDTIFNKHTFPNHDITKYPDNKFYNFVKDWIVNF